MLHSTALMLHIAAPKYMFAYALVHHFVYLFIIICILYDHHPPCLKMYY